tara:strand:- start:47 stop:565 length:519 start_codon:yes stop_codon:yes gene_type:complete
MKFLKLIPFLIIFTGIFSYENSIRAEVENPNEYKVLSTTNKTLSIANVKNYLKQGDKFIESGDLDKAKGLYTDARDLATNLASFYSDLNKVFKGVDARIPIEMRKKGKASLQILAESNARLASLYIKNEKPDVAVPLLIENIRILSIKSPEGKEAYKTLMQLGFVETDYKGQ